MAYKQKKKNLGAKIMIWFLVFAMVSSFLGTIIYYLSI